LTPFAGGTFVFNRRDSEFGNRRWPQILDRLDVRSDGIGLVRGDGTGGFFDLALGTTSLEEPFRAPVGSYSKLVKVFELDQYGEYVRDEFGDPILNHYELRHKHGGADHFDPDGLLTARVDANGNWTTFAYTDADMDAIEDELASITAPGNLTTTYAYDDMYGQLVSIVDSAGRVTNYAYDTNGYVSSVTLPDPDGAGPDPAPTFAFTYTADGLIENVTDPAARTLSVEHNAGLRFNELTNPDGSNWTLEPAQTAGLVDVGLVGGDSPNNPASSHWLTKDKVAALTDELGRQVQYKTDRFGRLLSHLR